PQFGASASNDETETGGQHQPPTVRREGGTLLALTGLFGTHPRATGPCHELLSAPANRNGCGLGQRRSSSAIAGPRRKNIRDSLRGLTLFVDEAQRELGAVARLHGSCPAPPSRRLHRE